jgi:hypothetical protein
MPRTVTSFLSFSLYLLLAVAGAAQTVKGGGMALDSLAPLRWEKRIVLVFADKTPDFAAAVETLTSAEKRSAIEERDIVWFAFGPESLETNFPGTLAETFGDAVRTRYFPPEKRGELDGAVAVVLIGKDGGVKLRAAGLNLEEIFTLIDGMPMRRAEMRRQAD